MVYSVRENCGRMLAIESPVEADIVSTIPESATPAAFGYSKRTGIPYAEVGRWSQSANIIAEIIIYVRISHVVNCIRWLWWKRETN